MIESQELLIFTKMQHMHHLLIIICNIFYLLNYQVEAKEKTSVTDTVKRFV